MEARNRAVGRWEAEARRRGTGGGGPEQRAEPPAASEEMDKLVCPLWARGRAVPSLLSGSHRGKLGCAPPPAGTEMEKESKHLIDALGTLTSYPAAPPDVCLSPDNRAHTAQREAFFRRMPSPLQPARAHCVPREEARERNIWGNKCVGEMCCRRVNVRWNGSCCLGSFP